MSKYYYIVDTKLVAYYLIQRHRPITDIFNKIADLLIQLKKKGEVLLCFDVGKSSYRLGEQSYYKAHRAEQREKQGAEVLAKHDEFNDNYMKILEIYKLLDVNVLAIEGVEADDLASMTVELLRDDPNNRITLITGDYDWLHMVVGTNNVRLYDFPYEQFWYHKDVVSAYNVMSRRQFSIKKSLIGDKSDNIKFIKNMAEVKGTELFEKIIDTYDDPADHFVIKEVEKYMEGKPTLSLHNFHVKDGRTTIKEAFESNMCIADPFTDDSKLSPEQKAEWGRLLAPKAGTIIDNPYIDTMLIGTKLAEEFGYFVSFSKAAEKVYKLI